jgi:hypothetical protein
MAASAELVEKVDALDQWLRKGGFLPTDWRKQPSFMGVNNGSQ